MIYLASPYSHPDPAVRAARYQAACEAAAQLMRAGKHVFSPITHSHGIAECGVPGDWAYWESFDRRLLQACDELVVLMLDGWRESRGVQAEIDLAMEMDLPVSCLAPTQVSLAPSIAGCYQQPANTP